MEDGLARAVAVVDHARADGRRVSLTLSCAFGCPYEGVVYALEREGIATGVDLDALIETARWLSGVLDRPVPGRVQRAGPWPR